jgi:ubiquitin carboxyl-terminal hydrolase 48
LYGLGEKKWLTNKDEDFLTDFENPNDERKKDGTFVGLKNLGATCYVNSLLQVWFHNPFLREAIYKWKPEDDQKEIREQLNKSLQEVELIGCKKNGNFTPVSPVGQLQLIFTRLQFSLRCFVDPTHFVNSLDLDVSTQQDAQEFSKLFLTLLEEDLSNQKNGTVRNIVQTQYRGEYVYKTRCQNCLTESKSPSNFYELGLNIKGHKDIYECLEEFFAVSIFG